MTPKRDWFTIGEAASRSGAPLNTFYRWVRKGQIEHVVAGNRIYLIHESEVEAVRRNGGKPVARLDPNKRYRLKSTGEIVTGAELLRRRASGDD